MRKVLMYFVCGLGLWFLFFASPKAYAATGSISVTPQIEHVDLSRDAPIANFTYKSSTPFTIELNFSIEDVKELEEIGIPGFIGPGEDVNYKYGLSSWASLSTQTEILNPGEEKTISVLIDKKRVSLGGHYASILAEVSQPDTGKNVKLRAVMAALLFVRAGSEFDIEDGKIATFLPDNNLFSFPESFILRFQNTGNVDVTPYGLLEVTDVLGRRVAKGVVNKDSLISLPESIRRYNIPLNSETNLLLPGLYHAHVALHFGQKRKDITQDISFFSLGSVGAGGVLIPGVALLVLLILLKFKRRGN